MKIDPWIVLFALVVVGFAWRECETVVDDVVTTEAP